MWRLKNKLNSKKYGQAATQNEATTFAYHPCYGPFQHGILGHVLHLLLHIFTDLLFISDGGMVVSSQVTGLTLPPVTPNDSVRNEQWSRSHKHRNYGCSNVDRVTRMDKICRQNHIREYKYESKIGKNNTVNLLFVDDDRKLLYCQIGKVGSVTFIEYLLETKLGTPFVKNTYKYFTKANIKRIWKTPVSEIDAKYKDYTRFVVVRHPLQRVVSAYYETIIKRKLYRQNKSTEPMSLDEFLRNVTGNLMEDNDHWTRYHNVCKLCLIKYDYVVQTETMESDILKMADVFHDKRQIPPATLKYKHVGVHGENISEVFRYDRLLKEFQLKYPVYMERLLRLYMDDMQLFDYGWDSDNMRSLCRESIKTINCCS